MARPVEHYPSEHVVIDDNGDVRVADDFMEAGNTALIEIPDAPILPIIYKPEAQAPDAGEDTYYAELEKAEQKLGSFDLARADLARRNIIEPRKEQDSALSEPHHTEIGNTGLEAIHLAAFAEKLAQAEKIADPAQRQAAINHIHALERVRRERRNDPSGPVSRRHHS